MPRWAGPLLRRVGLLIEMGCILGLVAGDIEGREVAGISVRPLLRAGLVLGFLSWGLGIALIRRAARKARS